MLDQETRKITAHIPAVLLDKAQDATGAGITDTIKQGLEMLARAEAYEQLLKLEGKVKFSIDPKELRRDKK